MSAKFPFVSKRPIVPGITDLPKFNYEDLVEIVAGPWKRPYIHTHYAIVFIPYSIQVFSSHDDKVHNNEREKSLPLHGLSPLQDSQTSNFSYFPQYLVFFFLERLFAQNNCNDLVKWILACFWDLQLLTQTDHFVNGIAFFVLQPLQDRRFSKLYHFSNIWGFSERRFAQNNRNVLVEWVLACVPVFLIRDPNLPFCKGFSLCKMAEFQICLISRIFGVFSSGFLHRSTVVFC